MDWHGRSIRMGAWVIAVAVVLRLWSTGVLGLGWTALADSGVGEFLVYLETGRVVRPEPESTPPETSPPETVPWEKPVFSAGDGELVQVWGTGENVDPAEYLTRPLDLDLTGEEPTVLILHTHATESYTQAPGWTYAESSSYRTLDTDHNLCAVGAYLAQLLEAAGIGVIHDTTFHDYPEYTGAYTRSQATAEYWLEKHPGIRLILDLHRDSMVDDSGREMDTSAQVNGRESARILLLMGTDYQGWQENMNLAVKLTAQLEKLYPGMTRGILTRTIDYNQFLSPGALLVEMGAAGNTQEEALVAAEALAQALILLSRGAD